MGEVTSRRPARPVVPEMQTVGGLMLLGGVALLVALGVAGEVAAVVFGLAFGTGCTALMVAVAWSQVSRQVAAMRPHDGAPVEDPARARLRSAAITVALLALAGLVLWLTEGGEGEQGLAVPSSILLGTGASQVLLARRWRAYERAHGIEVLRRTRTFAWNPNRNLTYRPSG